MFEVIPFVVVAASAMPAEPNMLTTIIGAVFSSVVFSAIITAVFTYVSNRRNARIQERKNDLDAEGGLVSRYKEAAAEERAQKESAIQTVRDLLKIAEEQVTSLKDTITTLNSTIGIMRQAADDQREIITRLTSDRDRTQDALDRATKEIDKQREQLIKHQHEILAMSLPNMPDASSATG